MGREVNSPEKEGLVKVSIVIPAYNEEMAIGNVVSRVQKVDSRFEVIVVDDASIDATHQRAEDAGARVISLPYKMGNGAAVKTGIRAAVGHIVVLLDGDGQHQPEDIPKLLEPMGRFDMVVGSRTSNSPVSRVRRLGNWGLTLVAKYLTGISIPDLTSGFRAIKRKQLLDYLHLLPNTFSYPTTITLAFLKSGNPVTWIPLDTIRARQTGKSQINPFQDGIRFIEIMLRIIMLFDPQRIFLPISALFLVGGGLLVLYNIFHSGNVQESSVLLIIIGVLAFCFGLLAEQVAHIRRELTRREN